MYEIIKLTESKDTYFGTFSDCGNAAQVRLCHILLLFVRTHSAGWVLFAGNNRTDPYMASFGRYIERKAAALFQFRLIILSVIKRFSIFYNLN